MTQPERETLFAAVDALLSGERIALLIGDGARPVEAELTAATQALLRPRLLKELQLAVHALPPDADGYAPARDAAASYDAAIAAKREKTP